MKIQLRPMVLVLLLAAATPAPAIELGHLVSSVAWAGALVPNPWQRLDPLGPCPDAEPALNVIPTTAAAPTPTPVDEAVADQAPPAAGAAGGRPLDWRAMLPGALR